MPYLALHELNNEPASLAATSATSFPAKADSLIQSSKQNDGPTTPVKRKACSMDFLLKIISPITPIILASAAILSSQLVIVQAEGVNSIVQFCKVNAYDVSKLRDWLAATDPTFSPFFLTTNIARKAFSSISAYPTLGYDTSLPHHRPESVTSVSVSPTQSQYPAWYFFYGTLADSSFLARLFASPPGSMPVLVPALIHGGKVRTWRQEYNALVECPGAKVDGWAYEVKSQDQEDTLRVYETFKYEVVRVSITLNGDGRVMQGCTLRFAGEERDLD
jgi:hypothetical protein